MSEKRESILCKHCDGTTFCSCQACKSSKSFVEKISTFTNRGETNAEEAITEKAIKKGYPRCLSISSKNDYEDVYIYWASYHICSVCNGVGEIIPTIYDVNFPQDKKENPKELEKLMHLTLDKLKKEDGLVLNKINLSEKRIQEMELKIRLECEKQKTKFNLKYFLFGKN